MSPILYTNSNFNSIVLEYTPTSKSMLDILEVVLCDGWQPIEVSSASVSNNVLTITSPNSIPSSFTWYALCVLNTRTPQIDGEWRCTGVNEMTATFEPVDRIVPDYTGSVTGSMTQISAGWTKLYKSADFLVVRPANEQSRCFMFKQNLGNGMVTTLNDVYSTTTKMINSSAINNEHCQCYPLHSWDNTLSPIDNFNNHVIPIRNQIAGVTTYSATAPVIQQIKPQQNNNNWYVVATDKYCYFGIYQNNHYNISGIGITPNVYGQDCLWIAGGIHNIDSNDMNSISRAYSISSTNIRESNSSILVQDPTGQTMLGRFRTIDNWWRPSNMEISNRLSFIDATTEDVTMRIEYYNGNSDPHFYMVPYFKMPGACVFYGNTSAGLSYEKINNSEYMVVLSYANVYPDTSHYTTVGFKI